MLVLRGAAEVANWTPEVDLLMSPQALHLAELVMQGDPLFEATFEEAVQIAASDGDAVVAEMDDGGMGSMMEPAEKGVKAEAAIAKFAADRLRMDTRIASFDVTAGVCQFVDHGGVEGIEFFRTVQPERGNAVDN